MIRNILSIPRRCLDSIADYCLRREEASDNFYDRKDAFAIPEIFFRSLAHPIQTYRDIRELTKPLERQSTA